MLNYFSSPSISVAPALTLMSPEVCDSFQGPNLVIHEPEEVLASMNEWCQIHHKNSGMRQNQSPLSHPINCREHVYMCTPKHTLMIQTCTCMSTCMCIHMDAWIQACW